jgi:hypothetical protein
VSNEGAITSRVHRAWLGTGMGHVAKRGPLDEQGTVAKSRLMRRLRSKFRSNFLHVIARTRLQPRLTSMPTTGRHVRPRETMGNALTEAGLTDPLDRI